MKADATKSNAMIVNFLKSAPVDLDWVDLIMLNFKLLINNKLSKYSMADRPSLEKCRLVCKTQQKKL